MDFALPVPSEAKIYMTGAKNRRSPPGPVWTESAPQPIHTGSPRFCSFFATRNANLKEYRKEKPVIADHDSRCGYNTQPRCKICPSWGPPIFGARHYEIGVLAHGEAKIQGIPYPKTSVFHRFPMLLPPPETKNSERHLKNIKVPQKNTKNRFEGTDRSV